MITHGQMVKDQIQLLRILLHRVLLPYATDLLMSMELKIRQFQKFSF